MELEKMSGGCAATPPEELRKRFMDVCTPHNEEHWWAIGEIDRLTQHLALKDADLLQERGRAEKLKAQVKMLVELLEETEGMLQHTKCLNEDALKCPACSLESRIGEALAKIKEQ